MSKYICERCAYACSLTVNGSGKPKACPYLMIIPEWVKTEE